MENKKKEIVIFEKCDRADATSDEELQKLMSDEVENYLFNNIFMMDNVVTYDAIYKHRQEEGYNILLCLLIIYREDE